ASFPLCAIAAHALAHEITARHDAAAVAGLAYGFNPYRLSQISHVQMLWVFWSPLALLALHRYARDGRRRWLILFAAMWLGQALSTTYFLNFLPILLSLLLFWFLVVVAAASAALRRRAPSARRTSLTRGLWCAAAASLAVGAVSPVVGPWQLRIGSATILSVASATKPLTVALWCAAFSIVSSAAA